MPDARALYKRGFACFVDDAVDDAIALYRQAIEADPELAIAWNGLSIALAQQGNFSEAIEAAGKLVELEPEDALSHTNLSRILMQQGKITEAEDAKAIAMRLQMKQQS
jgi:tetratricopeptide (TPR) repeat protein